MWKIIIGIIFLVLLARLGVSLAASIVEVLLHFWPVTIMVGLVFFLLFK